MQHDFWHQRWAQGQIGFHAPDVHWALTGYWQDLTHHSDAPVFVPLCGKSRDMVWLQQRGHPVTGVELNAIAVHDFFEEWGHAAEPQRSPAHTMPGYHANRVRLWQGDFFSYLPDDQFELFYDRAALIALPAAMRFRYVKHLRRCLKPGASGLLVTLEYEQILKDGPPFSFSFEEVSGFAEFEAEPLERRDVLDDHSKFKSKGVPTLHETVYRLVAL